MSKYTTARLARLRRLRSKKKLTVSKVKKIAQKVIDKQVEFKRITPQIALNVLDTLLGKTVFDGPAIPEGDGIDARTGNQVMMRKMNFKCVLQHGVRQVHVKMVLIRYSTGLGISGPSPAIPAIGDFLQDPANPFTSPWLKDSAYKYKVCYNKVHTLGTVGVMPADRFLKYFNISVKLPKAGEKITYENNTTQTPDKNRYCLFAIPDYVSTDVPARAAFKAYATIGYTDM